MKKNVFYVSTTLIILIFSITACGLFGQRKQDEQTTGNEQQITFRDDSTNSSLTVSEKDNDDFIEIIFEEDKDQPEEKVTSALYSEKIPQDYPHNLCPIYSPAEVLNSVETSSEGSRMYIISLLTTHEASKVMEFYQNFGPSEHLPFINDMLIFKNADGKTNVTVQVSPTEEDSEWAIKGNKTLIVLSVLIEN